MQIVHLHIVAFVLAALVFVAVSLVPETKKAVSPPQVIQACEKYRADPMVADACAELGN